MPTKTTRQTHSTPSNAQSFIVRDPPTTLSRELIRAAQNIVIRDPVIRTIVPIYVERKTESER